MALVECHECGNPISTEAKVCPQCGAKNRNRKRFPRIVLLIGVAILGYILYVAFEHELNLSIPACDSSRAAKVFEGTFENSPYAQTNKFKVLDVTDQKEIRAGSRPEDRVCEATLRINNGTERTYIFTFERKESGSYLVKGEPR